MYAAGTEGLASSAGAIRRLIGTSRRRRSRSNATTVAMTRRTGDSRFTSGMASGSHGGNARLSIGDRDRGWCPVAVTRVAATLGGGSRAAAAAQRGTHSSSAPAVAPSDRDLSSVLVMVTPILLPASLVDALGECLFRSAPEASHHQRRHRGNAGHDDPIRNGRDADGDRRKEDRNRPGNEQQLSWFYRRT